MKSLASVLLTMFLVAPASAQTEDWPQFSGAASDGLAEGKTLPESWSTTETVVWKETISG